MAQAGLEFRAAAPLVLKHVIVINLLVFVGQFALKQFVDIGDDLFDQRRSTGLRFSVARDSLTFS
jgi:hypothetical protein